MEGQNTYTRNNLVILASEERVSLEANQRIREIPYTELCELRLCVQR